MPTTKLLPALLLLAACSDDADPRGPAAERVELPGPQFYPEGVAFDDAGTMYVSSILTGAVARFESGATTATELVPANKLAPSLIGIAMSQKDDLLWVCLGTFGTDNIPAVIGVRRTDGSEVVRHAFPSKGLCNELTEDAQGNIYASDTFGARILRIPAAQRTTANSAAVWAQGPALGAQMFGVNGITFDGKDALLAVNSETGALLRVALDDASITEVMLERKLAGPDGIRRADDGSFIVVEQGAGRVSRIDLEAKTLTPLREGLRTPTSLDVIDDRAWVAEGQLSHIFDMTQPELPFFVHLVELD